MLVSPGHVDKAGLEPVVIELEPGDAFPELLILFKEIIYLIFDIGGKG
jgi:hypothetical protein